MSNKKKLTRQQKLNRKVGAPDWVPAPPKGFKYLGKIK